MKSLGSLPASSRPAVRAIGLASVAVFGAVIGLVAQSAQQTPSPASNPPAPQAQQTPQQTPAAQPQAESQLTAKSSPAVFLNVIKPDKTADFEAAMNKIKEALAKTDKEDLKKLAEGWQVYKVAETAQPGSQNVIYLWLVNPAVVGSAYDPGKIIYDAFPRAEADDVFNKLKDSYSQLNRWTLEKVLEMKGGGGK